MRLRALELDEFRSFRSLRLEIDPAGFRVIGANASGKSTLLESIAMLATTRSPRTSTEREIANWESGRDFALPPYARLRGTFDRLDGQHSVDIGLAVEDQGRTSLKKQIRFDDQPARAIDVIGQFKTVLFSPEDVNLMSGPPAARRRYLDIAISQASRDYLRALSRYGRVLEQRNSLLRAFARDRVVPHSVRSASELQFWDSELVSGAAEVVAQRLAATAVLSRRAKERFLSLTGDDSLQVTYVANRLTLPEFGTEATSALWPIVPQQLRQGVAAAVANAVESWKGEEIRRGVTAIGPHRDDFSVYAGGVNLGTFGSRGQQRLALIAIKIAEVDILRESAGEPPVLLLDDVLSELDAVHRRQVVELIAAPNAQICVTATDSFDLGVPLLDHLPLMRADKGSIVSHHAP